MKFPATARFLQQPGSRSSRPRAVLILSITSNPIKLQCSNFYILQYRVGLRSRVYIILDLSTSSSIEYHLRTLSANSRLVDFTMSINGAQFPRAPSDTRNAFLDSPRLAGDKNIRTPKNLKTLDNLSTSCSTKKLLLYSFRISARLIDLPAKSIP